MTTLDTIYAILYYYGAIAVIWATTMLFMFWLCDKTHVPVKALVFSTVLWPYTMYLSLKATLFRKNESWGE